MTPNQHLKSRLLTGDTPTGRLHLGHWVGSLENRVAMQDDYECYFLIANLQAFTTRAERPQEIQQSVKDILLDYLAAGIDPKKSAIFLQTEVPAIAELTQILSMIIPFPRLMRNPTIKDEIRDKQLGEHYSAGFLFYPVSQVADILAFRANVVPVGIDQAPHLELAREVARRFNQWYCGVDPQLNDDQHLAFGGLFPIFETKIGRVNRLIGTGGPGENGQLLKMSKSLDNAIFLSDDADTIRQKVMGMYTDPTRLRASDKGHIENNPLWIFHDTFNDDKAWIAETKARYLAGTVGDVECKKRLIDVLTAFIEPFSARRKIFENDFEQVKQILRDGTERAIACSEKTLAATKTAICQDLLPPRKVHY